VSTLPANPGPIRVFTFGPAWGLPTMGPFGLKLIACLSMLGVPFELVRADDARQGPKRKSPWIEDGDVRLGDTELILAHLERTRGLRLDADLDPARAARGLAIRRLLEEHFHQIFEHELLLRGDGFEVLKEAMRGSVPALVFPFVAGMMRRSMRYHLFERGIGRHTAAEIEAMGRADLDALVALLGDQPFFLGDAPTKTDASAFGLLAVTIRSGIPGPVASYARSRPSLVAFVERGSARWLGGLTRAAR
jgi:glutathione S-transferase